MKHPLPSAVIFAKDVVRLGEFYTHAAEMKEIQRDNDHVVLETSGFQLVVHGIPKKIAAAIVIGTPPALREDTPIKICLPVASIASARSKATDFGGAIGAKSKEWEARGFRACDGFDPEGNIFQVRETAS